MKNNILKIVYVCCLFLSLAFFGCDDDNETTKVANFEIDCENSSIEGSFVQNVSSTDINTFNLHYIGGDFSAKVSSNIVNGVYISEQQVNFSQERAVKIPIEGKPIDEGDYTLKIEVDIDGRKFYCSQIFTVFKDENPDAPITFTMDEKYNNIEALLQPIDIPFTVDPIMSSIVEKESVEGLNVKVTIDRKTGEGIINLIPSDNFIGGKLELLVVFGARESIPVIINASAFISGDGSVDKPYEINSVELLKRIPYLLDKHFKLTADIDMKDTPWIPAGTETEKFKGSLDGNGKKITNLQIAGDNNVALFSYTAKAAIIKNLTISGEVTGQEYVAGLVAVNEGTIANCTATDIKIGGDNYLSAIAAKNTGTIISSDPIDILAFENFPSLISEITSEVTKQLNYTPATAVATIVKQPENIQATISGSALVLTPQNGFVNSEMSIQVTLKNIKSTEKLIKLFAEEQFDDGDGTAANPFLISKATQFSKIRSYQDKHFRLTSDIDLSSLSDPKWSPIPAFSGSIDGRNFKIKNLLYTEASEKGGIIVSNTGDIKNIAFTGVDIATKAAFGVVVGEHNSGTIENVVVTGKLTSTHTGDILGGIAGEILGGRIHNAYVKLDIEATCGMVGGIAGRARSSASTISNCTVEGNIKIQASKTRIAGIVGRGETGVIIKNCLSAVNINAIANNANGIGGIFGANNNNNMSIEECMFTGTINNVFMAGGIAGVGANIRNCLVEGQGAIMSSPMINIGGSLNTSSGGGIVGTGKVKVENNIFRNASITGATATTMPISGISSTFQDNGYVGKSVVDNVILNGTTVRGIAGVKANGSGINSNNYSSGVLYYENGSISGYTPDNDAMGLDGATKVKTELTQSFYQSIGFDFENVWSWENGKPVLRNVGYKGNISAL